MSQSRALQFSLYSGIALVVISMLFLVRGSETFFAQAALMLAAPAFFFGVGALVYRYLNAPLAAPGIVSTGAWLIGVGMLHLNDQLNTHRAVLPPFLQAAFWPVATLAAVIIITWTGHRIRSWLVVPLVPVLQLVATFTLLDVIGLPLVWWTPFAFALVIVWWEARLKSPWWAPVYRVAGLLLMVGLIAMSYTLVNATRDTIFATWAAATLTVIFLGLRQGWLNFVPVAIVMVFCASLWGLAPEFWALVWLTLAVGTILFIETRRMNAKDDASFADNWLAIDLSVALAVLLCGGAALYATWNTVTGTAGFSPLYLTFVHLTAGVLLTWLGWRRERVIAAHLGLWLVASAWTQVYVIFFMGSQAFGMWLSLLAALALLAERLLTSARSRKNKPVTLLQAVMRWPLADLSLGLTIIVTLWTLWNIQAAAPLLLTMTTATLVGIWIIAGLFYRLPVLLHTALWIAPLPFMLLMVFVFPGLRNLPYVGFVWQMLGVIFVLLGHSLYRQRPAIVIPFFVAGHGLINASLLLTLHDHYLLPVSLGVVVLMHLFSSGLVILGLHPTWDLFVANVVSPDARPFAYQSLRNLFLLMGSWLAVVWMYILLTFTGLTFAQYGIVLVLLSAIWIIVGRILPRIPGAMGWPVYGAGWILWCLGLIHAFPFPREALTTVIMGLVISSEAIRSTRAIYWTPVVVAQILFTILQAGRLLHLPAVDFSILAMTAVALAGFVRWNGASQRYWRPAAQFAGVLAVGLYLMTPGSMLPLMGFVPLTVAVAYRMRAWGIVFVLNALWALVAHRLNAPFSAYYLVGIIEFGLGSVMLGTRTPEAKPGTVTWMATAAFWSGAALMLVASALQPTALVELMAGTALITLVGALVSRQAHALYLPLLLLGGALVIDYGYFVSWTFRPEWRFSAEPVWWVYGGVFAGGALLLYLGGARARAASRRIWHARAAVFGDMQRIYGAVALWLVVDNYHTFMTGYAPLMAVTAALTLWAALNQKSGARDSDRWRWIVLVLTTLLGLLFFTTSGGQDFSVALLALYIIPLAALNDDRLLEFVALCITAAGFVQYAANNGVTVTLVIMALVQCAALLVYGFFAQRRLPFMAAIVLLMGGAAVAVIRIDFWVVPLLLGGTLMGAALLLEVRRDSVAQHVSAVRTRWGSWR